MSLSVRAARPELQYHHAAQVDLAINTPILLCTVRQACLLLMLPVLHLELSFTSPIALESHFSRSVMHAAHFVLEIHAT